MQKYNNPAHRKDTKIRRLTIPESDKNDAKIKQNNTLKQAKKRRITIPESENKDAKIQRFNTPMRKKNTHFKDT